MPEKASRGRLAAVVRSRIVIVPVLVGLGVYFIAASHTPGRLLSRSGPVLPATIDPTMIALGAGLLALALLVYLRRD